MQQPLDPRAIRAEIQDRQSTNGRAPDHRQAVSEAVAHARRPDLVAALLTRAADRFSAADPVPSLTNEAEDDY